MWVAGVDVGSVAAKAVLLHVQDNTLWGSAILPTGWNTRQAGQDVLQAACTQAGVDAASLRAVVGTGYGRISMPFASKSVTEITCHARGAVHLYPEARVVLDIGGQDSKAICLDARGAVVDFVMNDKCAAGTGRFLQVLSGILGMDLESLNLAATKGKPLQISSMCAVFAETEITGLLAAGTPSEDIVAGVYLAIARRMRALAGRISLQGACVFTGGLAVSEAFATCLSQELGLTVHVPQNPQSVGALGAALIATTLV